MGIILTVFYLKGGVVMDKRGNKPLNTNKDSPATLHCLCCDKEYDSKEFYQSDSELHKSIGKIPYCKNCIDTLYQGYLEKYKKLKYLNADRKAIERLCMIFDIWYDDELLDKIINQPDRKIDTPLIALYLKQVKLYQHRNKNYDTTIQAKYKALKDSGKTLSIFKETEKSQNENINKAIKLFGKGFENEDYMFLYEQYCDWTMRHECNTKTQEELFKRICFKQLEIYKATLEGQDTKDLDKTFQELLATSKLQPKQNLSETMAETQVFGTLIDKWENTRPIPETDEELRDVDKIGLYTDVFFRGHLAKMMGLKNAISNLYAKFIKKYTVEKPEYDDNEDGEALFDAIFGNANLDE